MQEKLAQLKSRLLEINDLDSAAAVLHWDQSTYMPPGGAPARGRQIATLARLAHGKFIDPAVGELLDALQPHGEGLPHDADDAALIRVTRHEYEKAVKVPPDFIAGLYAHMADTYAAWVRARPSDDFGLVQPLLEKTLDLSRRLADFFPGYRHIADPLIDYADHGMTVAILRPLFEELREQLLPLVRAIASQPVADDACLRRNFPEPAQLAFGRTLIERFGYDFGRGRCDKTPHPFMTTFSLGDVRITTRVKENFLGEALFSMMHEAGHALYEQGIAPELDGTPLADGASSGVHESQSRLWENLVGRSRPFWTCFYPELQAAFPEQLESVPLDAFYRAINQVRPSLIRTDADEVTYNLHVIIRFELEIQLLEGGLAVRDLPEAWRDRYRALLGVAPPGDRDGVLQDMHWYSGTIGGSFQCYTLGNILSAQFFEKATEGNPEILAQIEKGEFGTLLAWLRQHIHRHGSKFTPQELVERITGGPMQIAPYIRYLRNKYGELYPLQDGSR